MVFLVLSSHSRSRFKCHLAVRAKIAARRERNLRIESSDLRSISRSSTESVTGPVASRLAMAYFPSPSACAGSSRQMRSNSFCC